MDTVDVSNEVIVEKVVVIVSREFPDAAVSQPRDCSLLHINTPGIVSIVALEAERREGVMLRLSLGLAWRVGHLS